MIHRIRAAGIAVDNNKILLIKHVVNGKEFWVPPGGGLEQCDTSTIDTVKREIFEEAGLSSEIGDLVFVREFYEKSKGIYHLEQFYRVTSWTGCLTISNLTGLGGDEHVIKAAQWVSRERLDSITVYPEELRTDLWEMLDEKHICAKHLGLKVDD